MAAPKFLFILFFALPISLMAQHTISGRIIDQQNVPVEFATVLLQTADSTFVQSSLSDENGYFELNEKEGEYILDISFMGSVLYRKEISVYSQLDLGTIQVENAQLLDEVVVSGEKKLIERRADRIIFNVDQSKSAGGNNALDLMKMLPGVSLGANEQIQMNGRAGVQVMLNGRIQYISGEDLNNLLRSIQADNINKIEIISSPGAKYDAVAKGGIINIVTSKSVLSGVMGSVGGAFQKGRFQSGGPNADISFRHKKLTLSAVYFPWLNKNFNKETDNRRYFNADNSHILYNEESYDVYKNRYHFSNLKLNYDISDRHAIGSSIVYVRNKNTGTASTNTYIGSEEIVDSTIVTTIKSERTINFPQLNAYYTYHIDSTGRQLDVNYDFFARTETKYSEYDNRYVNPMQEEYRLPYIFNQQNPFKNKLHAVSIDYLHPFKSNSSMDAGVKYVYNRQSNDVKMKMLYEDEFLLDTTRSNQFNYNEQIIALYINYNKTFKEKLEMNIGLRSEQTIARLHSITLDSITDRKFFNIFPNFSLGYQHKENHYFNYSISSQIERPKYRELNVFVYYISPNGVSLGNPNLIPTKSYSTDFTYVLKNIYSFGIGYQYNKDEIIDVTLQDQIKQQYTYTFMNYKYSQSLYYTFGLNKEFTKWFSANLSTNVIYNSFLLNINNEPVKRRGIYGEFSLNTDFILPKNFIINLFAAYHTPAYYGTDFYKAQGQVDLTFIKKMLDNRLILRLKVLDIFYTNIVRSHSDFLDQFSNFEHRDDSRRIVFSVRYNFNSGMKFNNVQRENKISDEKNRY